jgi:hypothetical protein
MSRGGLEDWWLAARKDARSVTVTIVSFYTPNWEYPAHAERLRRECERLSLPCVIEQRPDMGGYLANCRQKPRYLCEVRDRVSGPLLWVDVDGSILERPVDLPDVDFAARAKDKRRDRRVHRTDRMWHVGTLYFGDTEAARDLLGLWVEHLGDDSDEAALDRAWKSGHWSGSHTGLPAKYFRIAPHAKVPQDAIIVHRLSRSPAKRDAFRAMA